MKSLRIRLLLLLGVLIIATTVILFFTLFRTAIQQANRLFDYHMQQIALALRDSDFTNADFTPDKDEKTAPFDFVIQVWTEEGARVYQSREYSALPDQAVMGYSTVMLPGGEWIVYAVHTDNRVIQVAQPVKARRDRAIRLATRSLWPIAPISLVLLAATWWAVSAALAPLNRIGKELGQRNVSSLEPVHAPGIPREVTPLVSELNSLLKRLNQAMGLQQQFVADAAHELRSPLTALKLQLQILTRAKDEKAKSDAVAKLSAGIDRGVRLVEQLLSLARLDPAVHQDFYYEHVSLPLCARQAMSDIAALASSKKIALSYEEQSEAQITGDAESIRILIRNLVDNAVRYTPLNGEVHVFVGTENDAAVIAVSDSGPGISTEDQARVFDRFYRIPGTLPIGSGLGLPIVKAIAERHSATISLNTSTLGGLKIKVVFSRAGKNSEGQIIKVNA